MTPRSGPASICSAGQRVGQEGEVRQEQNARPRSGNTQRPEPGTHGGGAFRAAPRAGRARAVRARPARRIHPKPARAAAAPPAPGHGRQDLVEHAAGEVEGQARTTTTARTGTYRMRAHSLQARRTPAPSLDPRPRFRAYRGSVMCVTGVLRLLGIIGVGLLGPTATSG